MKIFFLSVFLLVSCSDDNFQKVEELDSFRVLGIVATAPEVAPGGSTTLQLLVSDVKGGATRAPFTANFESCLDPGISSGAPVTCDFDPTKVSGTVNINTNALGAANLYSGLTGSINVTVPASIFAGRSAREQSNGVGYITIVNFIVDGEPIRAFKRVIATNRPPNNNPSISSVTVNGGALRKPSKGDEFNAVTSTPETFDFINVDGSTNNRAEQTELAWYVSQGKLSRPKSSPEEEVEYLDDPPADPLLILTLIRDERGGLGFFRQVVP